MTTESKSQPAERFEENFKLLEQFSLELQENRVPIDDLIPRMRRALDALRVCRKVLKATKLQLKEIDQEFKEMESEAAEDELL